MTRINGYAAFSTNTPLKPFQFERREPLPTDVEIDIQYCGVCHSDLHSVNGDWGPVEQALVPGHEIVGRVTRVGSQVKVFKTGQLVGVGCLVDSCRSCTACRDGLEQYCEVGATFSYGSPDKKGDGITQGGYSSLIVTDQDFVVRVPENLPLEKVAPLLCAGITTYSPLKQWKVKKGDRVAIAGLGGLGHMGVKLAVAMGADVTVLSTSEAKRADALDLGAHHFVSVKNPEQLNSVKNHFDLILNTISADHDYNMYLNLLRRDGTMVLLGLPGPQTISAQPLIHKRRRLAGSLIGGIKETQEMLDFCGQHGITSDVEMIKMDQINDAYKRLVKNDVRYRFVVDMKSIK